MENEIKPLSFIRCVILPNHQVARYVRNAKYPRYCESTTSAILTSLLFVLCISINAWIFFNTFTMQSITNLLVVFCFTIFLKHTMSDYFVYRNYGVKNSWQFCQLDQFKIN